MSHVTVERVALIGGGVIGAGWGARFLLNGIDVRVYDPDPETKRKFDAVYENAERACTELTRGGLPEPGRLQISDTLEHACAGAEFVQESLPERMALKQSVLAQVSEITPHDAIIASSTSGLLPTQLQQNCKHPERIVVGHPFNPVYLMPLVEVCGGQQTSPETISTAMNLYRHLGMHPLHVRKEVDAFIADRLMEALWREALHMINEDVATAEEIDTALSYGPGLRWAFMGSFLTYRLAGGEAGMRHFLEHFAPALELPWTKLQAPAWNDELLDKLCAQSDDQAGDLPLRDLETLRDNCLVAIIQGLSQHNYAAGKTLTEYKNHLNHPDAT
ncbi:MAG: 3-hydroxyacyl-CoA dehydrogenase NAD-binding domain-containing protein [Pseudomonadota bacterium]